MQRIEEKNNITVDRIFDYKNTFSIQGSHTTVRRIVCMMNGFILTCGLNNPGYPYSKIYMWDTRTTSNEQLIYSPHRVYHTKIRDVYAIALFDENTFLCAGSKGKIERWDIETAKLIETYQYNQSPIFNIKILQDGRFATSGLSEVSVWDMDGSHMGILQGQRGIIHCIDELPNGDIITAGQSKKICIWDAATLTCKKIIFTNTVYVYSMLLLENNYVILGHSNGMTTWDLDEELRDPIEYYMRDVNVMCMTKITDSVIVYGDNNGMLVFFDLNIGENIKQNKISHKPITCVTKMYDDRIVTGTFKTNDYARFYSMPHLLDDESQIRVFENKNIPYLYSRYRMDQAMMRLAHIKDELMAIAWSPERHLDWCVDIETRKGVKRQFNT